ncbi:MAG TPA: nitrate reductase molybdenum cofactor assembly chaperone [Casimicrobiaceae bacterium]|nr:nitrate reductase molybdenum cofactor assembly chaperone [Casimicrobiaceae bacterium]
MVITYKALAALLAYPTAELCEALPEIRDLIDGEAKLGRRERRALSALIAELGASDLIDAQERYVDLFDRGRATSLNLFEHVHGESRDRGQAMVDLKATYAQAGLVLRANELPDYLPVLLEFLSTQSEAVARDMLEDCAHIVRSIGDGLAKRGSAYATIFAAILSLAGQRGLGAGPPSADERDRPLDDEWLEAPVVFGPGAACGPKDAATSVVQFMPRVPR